MTLSHAIKNISQYRRRYGLSKALKTSIHYGYVTLNKNRLKKVSELIEVNGSKLQVIPNDPFGTSAELLMFRTHEPISTKLVSKLLKKGMTCLDIGANIGYYVLLENKILGEEGNIIAIEPSPENFEYLEKNISRQNAKNIQSFNLAAGDKDGHINFLIYQDASNSGMVIPDNETSKWPGKVIKVAVKKIDSFLNEISVNKVDFVRMDVEGYEYHIFEGMKETLKKSKPIIHIEVHKSIMGDETTKKWFELLKDLGYESKYYIPRELDTPLIGTLSDVKNYSLDELILKLENKELPSFFMLSLK